MTALDLHGVLQRRPVSQTADPELAALRHVDPEQHASLWEELGAQRVRRLLGDDALGNIRRLLREEHHVAIKGLPADPDPPPTPYGAGPDNKDIAVSLANLFGLVGCLGHHAFAYRGENGGRIVRHVAPRPGAADEASSHGWASDLLWHMDGAHRSVGTSRTGPQAPVPRFLHFAVMRACPLTPITVVRLQDVLAGLDGDDIAALESPTFDVTSPDSFGVKEVVRQQPVLIPDGAGGHFSRYNTSKVASRRAGSCRALARFRRHLERIEPILNCLSPGDVVSLDNWKCLHTRSRFTPSWDGSDRWFIRIYAYSKDMPLMASFKKHSRVVI